MRSLCMTETNSAKSVADTADLQLRGSHYASRVTARVSIRARYLVERAMTLFDTDRQAAVRHLRDASALLDGGEADSGVNVRPSTFQAKRLLDHIDVNLNKSISIAALAGVVAMSRSHFSRTFKLAVGLCPMKYVAMRRVERAKQLLRAARLPLAEIALACGFADQAHLTRRFSRALGVSPGRWRRQYLAERERLWCKFIRLESAPGTYRNQKT
jgi:AraC family transcriptional regulator